MERSATPEVFLIAMDTSTLSSVLSTDKAICVTCIGNWPVCSAEKSVLPQPAKMQQSPVAANTFIMIPSCVMA